MNYMTEEIPAFFIVRMLNVDSNIPNYIFQSAFADGKELNIDRLSPHFSDFYPKV